MTTVVQRWLKEEPVEQCSLKSIDETSKITVDWILLLIVWCDSCHVRYENESTVFDVKCQYSHSFIVVDFDDDYRHSTNYIPCLLYSVALARDWWRTCVCVYSSILVRHYFCRKDAYMWFELNNNRRRYIYIFDKYISSFKQSTQSSTSIRRPRFRLLRYWTKKSVSPIHSPLLSLSLSSSTYFVLIFFYFNESGANVVGWTRFWLFAIPASIDVIALSVSLLSSVYFYKNIIYRNPILFMHIRFRRLLFR